MEGIDINTPMEKLQKIAAKVPRLTAVSITYYTREDTKANAFFYEKPGNTIKFTGQEQLHKVDGRSRFANLLTKHNGDNISKN